MNEQSPPLSAHQPLDRHATTVRAELVATLAVPHRVHGASTIELRAAFAESEQRGVTDRELEPAGLGYGEALNDCARPITDRDRERAVSHGERQIACSNRRGACGRARIFREIDEGAIGIQCAGGRSPRKQRNAHGVRRQRRNTKLDWLAGDDEILPLRIRPDAKHQPGAGNAEQPDCLPPTYLSQRLKPNA